MIGIFRVRESFDHRQEFGLLEEQCRQFAQEFAGSKSEFFYTLQPSEPERFLIVRAETQEREKFVKAVEDFSAQMNFEILKRRESEEVLFRHDIDSFV